MPYQAKSLIFLLIFLVVGVLILSLILAKVVELNKVFSTPIVYITSKIQKASLSISPNSGSFSKDQTFSVDILMDTDNLITAGADIILKYDPSFLEVIAIDTQESVFKNFVQKKITEDGKIVISALAPPKEGIKGKGKIASITFKGIKRGKTKVYFVYTKGLTDDTNLSEFGTGEDILKKVINAQYQIY